MTTFFQQALSSKDSFFVVQNQKDATHFRADDDRILPISQLVNNVPYGGKKETPLPMPKMDFSKT